MPQCLSVAFEPADPARDGVCPFLELFSANKAALKRVEESSPLSLRPAEPGFGRSDLLGNKAVVDSRTAELLLSSDEQLRLEDMSPDLLPDEPIERLGADVGGAAAGTP